MVKTFFALLLAVAAPALADDLTGRFGVGGSIAAAVPVGSKWVTDRNDTGLGLGGWLAYGLTRRWTARLGYDNLDFSRGPARLEDVTIGAAYQLDPESAWNPSVKVGAGPSFPRNVPTGKPSVFGLTAGLGVDRFVCSNFTIGAALDWLYATRPSGRRETHALRAGLTAGIWFGGVRGERRAAPAAVAPKSGSAVAVAVKPASVSLAQDGSQMFGASVTGSANQAVTWSLRPNLGTISPSGAYSAPSQIPAAQTVNVIATSSADPTKTASAQVNLLPSNTKVEIHLAVQFDTGKDAVKPAYDAELKNVAEFLKSYAAAQAQIEGHTDSVGDAAYNRSLSQRRADAVRKALIERFGADPGRLTAKGFGPDQPIADNATAPGRAQNRRVVATFSATK